MADFLRPHGLQSNRLLCSRDFPGKNTGVGCHILLQEIFPTQGLNLSLLLWQADSFHWTFTFFPHENDKYTQSSWYKTLLWFQHFKNNSKMCKIIVYYEGKLFYKLLYINLAIQASLYICRKRALGCVSTEKFKTIYAEYYLWVQRGKLEYVYMHIYSYVHSYLL